MLQDVKSGVRFVARKKRLRCFLQSKVRACSKKRKCFPRPPRSTRFCSIYSTAVIFTYDNDVFRSACLQAGRPSDQYKDIAGNKGQQFVDLISSTNRCNKIARLAILLQPLTHFTRRAGRGVMEEAVENWENMMVQVEFVVAKFDFKARDEDDQAVAERRELLDKWLRYYRDGGPAPHHKRSSNKDVGEGFRNFHALSLYLMTFHTIFPTSQITHCMEGGPRIPPAHPLRGILAFTEDPQESADAQKTGRSYAPSMPPTPMHKERPNSSGAIIRVAAVYSPDNPSMRANSPCLSGGPLRPRACICQRSHATWTQWSQRTNAPSTAGRTSAATPRPFATGSACCLALNPEGVGACKPSVLCSRSSALSPQIMCLVLVHFGTLEKRTLHTQTIWVRL